VRPLRTLADSAAGVRAIHSGDLGALERALAAASVSTGIEDGGRFLAAYRMYVRHLRDEVAAGSLGAEDWIEQIQTDLAHQYLRAVRSWADGDLGTTPAPWRMVFAAQRQRLMSGGGSLRASICAHVGYDMPIALARVGPGVKQQMDVREAAFERYGEHLAAAAPAIARAALRGDELRLGRTLADAEGVRAWLMSLWRSAWLDGRRLAESDQPDDRMPIFARMERTVLRELAALVQHERSGVRGWMRRTLVARRAA
jgi:hypothetical protein